MALKESHLGGDESTLAASETSPPIDEGSTEKLRLAFKQLEALGGLLLAEPGAKNVKREGSASPPVAASAGDSPQQISETMQNQGMPPLKAVVDPRSPAAPGKRLTDSENHQGELKNAGARHWPREELREGGDRRTFNTVALTLGIALLMVSTVGIIEAARRAYNHIFASLIDPTDPDVMRRRARAEPHNHKIRYELATRLKVEFYRIAQKHPGHVAALREEAIQWLRDCRSLLEHGGKSTALVDRDLAMLYSAGGDFPEAQACLENLRKAMANVRADARPHEATLASLSEPTVSPWDAAKVDGTIHRDKGLRAGDKETANEHFKKATGQFRRVREMCGSNRLSMPDLVETLCLAERYEDALRAMVPSLDPQSKEFYREVYEDLKNLANQNRLPEAYQPIVQETLLVSQQVNWDEESQHQRELEQLSRCANKLQASLGSQPR